MGLVRDANHFFQTFFVRELLSFKVENVFFSPPENRQSFTRSVKFSIEAVEIFEFCKEHIVGKIILFVASEVSAPCSHGNRFDPWGSWGTGDGVWGGHLARL